MRLGVEFLVGVFQPLHEELDVLGVDGRAAPHAKAIGGVAVGADVVGDVFGLEPGDHFLELGGVHVHRETHRGAAAGLRVLRQEVEPRKLVHRGGDCSEVVLGTSQEALEAA